MMRGGALFVALASVALVTGCASEPEVEIRPVGVSARGAASGDKLALANASLAMGNVGLALQEYRQALRVTPGSTAALSGIAHCYDVMGRADLARRYHEEALALAPADLPLLRLYAASLARNGAVAEAQAVISEIALRSKAPAAQWVLDPASPASQAIVAVTAVPPPAGPALSMPQQVVHETLADAARVAPGLPKARLERLSLGEIALVTTGSPIWVAVPKPSPARSVRLLNAARREGLAARHRIRLVGAGWRSVAIGNAPQVRKSSLILYPAGQVSAARRLAKDLRIAAIRPETRADILILLGRDRG